MRMSNQFSLKLLQAPKEVALMDILVEKHSHAKRLTFQNKHAKSIEWITKPLVYKVVEVDREKVQTW